ncbi:tRNA/rRNA methyltransferase [Myxococcus fulvus]|uniref:tRNA (Cytidine/uridine-2'-O-)-methyltransferase TrmJ n=1 Tax=Myxococcus fulvus TaxID=33 RepID=A0A511T7A6_MYXFU|nr:RNA methyltransferase [Myxococcus fulvus]AKF81333.1 RNA methyltransferase [Myxococcus fulvus 124B02]GEN10045.1 tRNA (cytidine/uridine-2'-O-)-methyltransferase TrmJ [Myxococcus fulvus]SEU25117.1 tRNA/rRNA methyltransferase [Myxococcus fulvus]
MALTSHLRVVLHQTQGPDNLGAVARLAANFGVAELVLADPQLQEMDGARRMAVHAGHILESARIYPTLPEALEDVVFAMGTTSRQNLRGMSTLSPEDAVALLSLHAQRGKVALVLGGEKRGMSDEDLSHCQQALVIPTRPEQPSMNLAQAAAVLLYLCAREHVEQTTPGAVEGAPLRLVQALQAWMRQVFLKVGFLNTQAPDALLAEMMHSLTRGALTRREVEMWLTAFKHLSRSVGLPKLDSDSKKQS